MTDFEEAVDSVKQMLDAIVKTPEIAKLQAKHAANLLEEYTQSGFTRDEAIQLICAGLKAMK